jgi:hypothetical protein
MAATLARYDSPALAPSKAGVAFSIGYPSDWAVAWGGERTRFYPPDASDGPKSALTFIHVDVIAKDERGSDALLNERDGLTRWVEATRPRFEIEDKRKVKVGPGAASCEALLVKDPARDQSPDRRELIILAPAGDVNFVLRCSAPLAEYSKQDALFKQVLASFEVRGG